MLALLRMSAFGGKADIRRSEFVLFALWAVLRPAGARLGAMMARFCPPCKRGRHKGAYTVYFAVYHKILNKNYYFSIRYIKFPSPCSGKFH